MIPANADPRAPSTDRDDKPLNIGDAANVVYLALFIAFIIGFPYLMLDYFYGQIASVSWGVAVVIAMGYVLKRLVK